MRIKKIKKLQLSTFLLFILTILIMSIGLMLIGFSNYYDYLHFNLNSKLNKTNLNGFSVLKYMSINNLLNYSAETIYLMNNNYDWYYYNWIQLQIGVIFCVILVPILTVVTISLTFLIIGLKIKIKNNNFWDAIKNCEIINNYYIH